MKSKAILVRAVELMEPPYFISAWISFLVYRMSNEEADEVIRKLRWVLKNADSSASEVA